MKFTKHQFLFKLVFCAIMASLSIVLDKFLSFPKGNSYLKFTLYGLPLMISGVMFGRKYGFIAGLTTGIILQLTSEYGVTLTAPIWALAPIAWGFVPGLISDIKKKHLTPISITVLVVLASTTALLLNTLAMFSEIWIMNDQYYTAAVIFTGLPRRIISAICLCPIYISVIYIIYNTAIVRFIQNNDEEENSSPAI